MKFSELETYRRRQRRLIVKNRLVLLGLPVVLLALWFWSGGGVSSQERRLMDSVRQAQNYLYDLRVNAGSEFERGDDPWHTGFIGLEWSPQTTTLGDLQAKRTSCDPRWSVIARRWMESLGVQQGDCVAVYASSSFPGMNFNVLRALESLDVQILLVVSLGASTWGANDPMFSWPVYESELRSAGYLHTKAFAYTLGGDGEIGGGIEEEGREILRSAAGNSSVQLVEKANLEEMIRWKMDLLEQYKPKAVFVIGGSEANMGNDQAIFHVRPGLHIGGSDGGNGVVGRAMAAGYPLIYMLNIRGLAAETGVPFDAPPNMSFHGENVRIAACVGAVVFAAVMFFYRRWSF